MKRTLSKSALFIAAAALLSFYSCNDQYGKSLEMGKKAKCEGEAAQAKLDQDPNDAQAQLELKQATDYIKFHREESGNEEKFRNDLADYTCP